MSSTTDVKFIQLRFDPEELAELDRYRRRQANPPTRSAAAKQLISRKLSEHTAADVEACP
jgi:hypothetical protein